jgi:hypothetical protein
VLIATKELRLSKSLCVHVKSMAENKVTTLIGFLEILVEIDPSIPQEYVMFTRSTVKVIPMGGGDFFVETNVMIGQKQAIPVKAGKYRVNASLGGIPSKDIDLDIGAGQVQKVTFFFGKES